MAYQTMVVCDGCKLASAQADPDEGLPAGWFLVAGMNKPGGWTDETEEHYCSRACVCTSGQRTF